MLAFGYEAPFPSISPFLSVRVLRGSAFEGSEKVVLGHEVVMADESGGRWDEETEVSEVSHLVRIVGPD